MIQGLFVAAALLFLLGMGTYYAWKTLAKAREKKPEAETRETKMIRTTPVITTTPAEREPDEPSAEDDDDASLIEDARKAFADAEGSPAEKALAAFEVLEEDYDLSEDELFEVLESFSASGLSREEQIAIAYKKSDLSFAETLAKWDVTDADVAASAAKAAEIEVDGDVYNEVRENADLKTAATVLKVCGATAEDIIGMENDYDSIENDEAIQTVAKELIPLGFSKKEILLALHETCDTFTTGELVIEALDTEIFSVADVVEMLVAVAIDLKELDEELRDADVDIKTSITILSQVHTAYEARLAEIRDGTATQKN